MHDILLTKSRIHLYGSGITECSNCRLVNETALHALRDWKVVRSMWERRVSANIEDEFYKVELQDWIVIKF